MEPPSLVAILRCAVLIPGFLRLVSAKKPGALGKHRSGGAEANGKQTTFGRREQRMGRENRYYVSYRSGRWIGAGLLAQHRSKPLGARALESAIAYPGTDSAF